MKVDKSERICAFCEKASAMYDDSVMLCARHGVVDRRWHCAKFSYDPLKRRPTLQKKAPGLDYIDLENV